MSSNQFDLVIRNGDVVDGTSTSVFRADIAVRQGTIVEVGSVLGSGSQELDATGRFVTPGFVDIHTHYDAQLTWGHRLSPSSGHGVTTVVTGNCGVGFAPCRASDRQTLIELMEGVEDIPGVVMAHGIPWNWTTFPDFLEALRQRHCDVDFGAQIPHSAIRVYVMGARGARLEAPTSKDLVEMTAIVREAILAGALGVTSSRSIHHRSKDGALAPSVLSEEIELMALARGLKEAGRGVFQIIPDPTADPSVEFALIRKIAEFCGRPVSFSLMEWGHLPNAWQTYLDLLAAAREAGLEIRAQVYPRPVGALFGLGLSFHPFSFHPSYQFLLAAPVSEQMVWLRNDDFRARLLSELPITSDQYIAQALKLVDHMFVVSDPPVYDPPEDQKIGALAAKKGISALDFYYDLLLSTNGEAILYFPSANYVNGNLSNVYKMLTAPGTILGLGDGGAHCGIICDASYPTYMLIRWVRDAAPAEQLSLPWAVAALTSRPAVAVGLLDRGVLKPGYRADINVIDLEAIRLQPPYPVHDLPKNGRRMIQPAFGYDATIVNGEVTYRRGTKTASLPGRLIAA